MSEKITERTFRELYLAIFPHRFHFLKFILEGYDGLAILSSVDGKIGTVRLRYPVESEPLLFQLLSALAPGLNKYTLSQIFLTTNAKLPVTFKNGN